MALRARIAESRAGRQAALRLGEQASAEHYVRVPFSEEDLIMEIIDCLGHGPLLQKATDLCVSRLGNNDAAVEIGDQTFVITVEQAHPVEKPS